MAGVSIFGGTSTTVIMFLGMFVYLVSVCGYHYDHLLDPKGHPLRWQAPAAAAAELPHAPSEQAEAGRQSSAGQQSGRAEGPGGAAVSSSNPLPAVLAMTSVRTWQRSKQQAEEGF